MGMTATFKCPPVSKKSSGKVPLCSYSIVVIGDRTVRQLAGLRTLLKKNENVKLFAISVDAPDVTKNFAEKIASDGKGGVHARRSFDKKE
jgi:molybdopterin-guanine dinucleotide biosynthesis protein A